MHQNTAPITLESLHVQIQELTALITQPKPITASIRGDLLSPTEVCDTLKISRSQFERMKRNGFIKIHRIDPNGRKVYVSLTEISRLFGKDFVNTTIS